MIYQPVNAYPYNNTIDASIANNFSWQFSGDNLQKYKIDIYQINQTTAEYTAEVTPTSTVYGGDEVVHSVPANELKNGNEYIWKITQYEKNPSMFVVSGTIVSASSTTAMKISTRMSTVQVGMFLSINGEQKEISTYNSETGDLTVKEAFSSTPSAGASYSVYTPFVTTLNGFYFKARKTPVITINDIDASYLDENNNLKYRHCIFTGTYTQEQNVSIKYHLWNLYSVSEDELTHEEVLELINNTDEIYNSNLTYEFDGFVTGTNYRLELVVNTQDNQTVTVTKDITVLYNQPVLVDEPAAIWNPENNSVMIDCQVIKISEPTVDGEYEFTEDGFLHITQGTITYDEVSGKQLALTEFTALTEFYADDLLATRILGLLSSDEKDDYYVNIDKIIGEGDIPQGRWYVEHLNKSGVESSQQLCALKAGALGHLQNTQTINESYDYLWFNNLTWDLSGQQFYVMNNVTTNPSKLYKLAMTNTQCIIQDENGNKYSVDVDTSPMVVAKLRLYMGVYYNYAILCNKTLSEDDLNKFFADDFTPDWNSFDSILILAPFDGDLVSSNIESLNTSDIEYIYIYRQKQGESRLHNIGRIELTQSYIEDLMVANDEIYTWYIVPVSGNEIGVSIATNTLYVRFDEWTINPMDYDYESGFENMYTTERTWKFGLNIVDDGLTQNILKTRFDGLSRYPKFTVEERNYITGSLSAYLSTITINDIVDTPEIDVYPEDHIFRRNSDIYYEPASKLREWNELVASGREVLIRDLKGHMYIAQIDSNSAKIDIYNQTSPTTITFTFTEVADWNETSVYVKGVNIDSMSSQEDLSARSSRMWS